MQTVGSVGYVLSLTYKLDLYSEDVHAYTNMKFLGQVFQRLEHEEDRQTDEHTDRRDQTY